MMLSLVKRIKKLEFENSVNKKLIDALVSKVDGIDWELMLSIMKENKVLMKELAESHSSVAEAINKQNR